jgi:CheY-like chemotaxis protein
MPDQDGYALVAKLRTLDRAQGRPLLAIALTGHASGIDRERALLAGFDAHVGKPIERTCSCVPSRRSSRSGSSSAARARACCARGGRGSCGRELTWNRGAGWPAGRDWRVTARLSAMKREPARVHSRGDRDCGGGVAGGAAFQGRRNAAGPRADSGRSRRLACRCRRSGSVAFTSGRCGRGGERPAVRDAVDRGITFLDNCWDYNGGASEERYGRALRDGYG